MSVCTIYYFSKRGVKGYKKSLSYVRVTDEPQEDWNTWEPEDLPEDYLVTGICGAHFIDERRKFIAPSTRF